MDKFTKLANIILIIVDIIVTIIIIGVISAFIQVKILNKSYANFFGYSMFQITTGSMSGTIEINDAVVVKHTNDVKIDDIVVFTEYEKIVTHRIIDENKDEYITRGDANTGTDKPVKKTDIIGKVVKIVPKFGVWVKVFSDRDVIICVVMTLIFLGFTISVGNKNMSRRERRRTRRKLLNEKNEKENKE